MTSNLSDDIEHETAVEEAKREGTCITILFYFVSNGSIRVYPQMAALRTSENLTSYQPLSSFCYTFL